MVRPLGLTERVTLGVEQEVGKILSRRDEQRGIYEGLRAKRYDEFMAGFSVIKSKLKQLYRMITLGGDADLEFADSMDPFSEGIIFSVRPPKKGWKNISNLSGGEKVRRLASDLIRTHCVAGTVRATLTRVARRRP